MSDILKMINITKQFGRLKANDNININVVQGEILALLGENGAGKSTLVNILYGLYKPTRGEIWFDGRKIVIDSPLKAIELGIGMVHQHFMLIPAFKTWENIVLGLGGEQKYVLNETRAKERIHDIAKKYNLTIDCDARIDTLSVGLQQQVEIAKVLYRGSKLLILDEPTGVLTPVEKVELFKTLRGLAAQGVSVIFISHKLNEVKEISDRVTVLNRGKNVDTVNTADVSVQELARMMVGHDVVFKVNKEGICKSDEVVLCVKDLTVQAARRAAGIENLNMCIRSGEVLGIAGVDGNGQSELVEAICGMRPVRGGSISICGKDVTGATPQQIIACGTALIPEDRKSVGCVLPFTIDKNLALRRSGDPQYAKRGLLNYKTLAEEADQVIEEYDIRLSHRSSPVALLSGGNLQKLILARELRSAPKLLVAMHPTRGLDVGAIEFIHGKILEARAAGCAVLLVSSELEEITALSDSVVVMHNGGLSDVLCGEDMNTERIGMLLGGVSHRETEDTAHA